MCNLNKLLVTSFLSGILVLCGYLWLKPEEFDSQITYQTYPLSMGDIESVVSAAGAINPVVTVDVGSELSGVISELLVDFNSVVKKGQLIARLDNRTLLARLQQTRADLVMAKANLEQQTASHAKSIAQLQLAKQSHTRQKELFTRGLISQSNLDESDAALAIAVADISLRVAQITASEANILQREAQLEQVNLDLERTDIRSPVAGIVINRRVDIGQTVAASFSAPILFMIAQDLEQMQIEADIDEADIGKLGEGLKVRFTVDAYPERTYRGYVSQVRKASKTVSNVVTYTVIITASNKDGSLLPGMTANVDIVLGKKEGVLRVPNSALRFRPAGASEKKNTHPLHEMMEQLDLSKEQKVLVKPIVKDMVSQMSSNRGNWRGDSRNNSLRQKFRNQLKLILTEEQFDKFSNLGRNRQREMRDGGKPGEIWVLKNGKPINFSVRTGISNDEYTEISGKSLEQGDDIIVRVNRQQTIK